MRQATYKEESGESRAAATRLAQHRPSVLQLAKELADAAAACRRRRIDRTSLYQSKTRFQTHGFAGLKHLPPLHKSHPPTTPPPTKPPQTTPPQTMAHIKQLAPTHPAYGCNRLEALPARQGRRLSSTALQKTQNENQLGTRDDRWLAPAKANPVQALERSAQQAALKRTASSSASTAPTWPSSCA